MAEHKEHKRQAIKPGSFDCSDENVKAIFAGLQLIGKEKFQGYGLVEKFVVHHVEKPPFKKFLRIGSLIVVDEDGKESMVYTIETFSDIAAAKAATYLRCGSRSANDLTDLLDLVINELA